MVHPKTLVESLQEVGVEFFTGVPDSLLKNLISYIEEQIPTEKHLTAANEGGAVALAAGYHLATGSIAAVYLQNSGLGNAVNPLVSLADEKVYSIPMVLIIGWRGEPGIPDEPQHLKQGLITEKMLETLQIPHVVLSKEDTEASLIKKVQDMGIQAAARSAPTAVLVREGVFEKYIQTRTSPHLHLTREEAIEVIVAELEPNAVVVSTTGKISRELYEVRMRHGGKSSSDFLTVGSMGHSSQIALAIALEKRDRPVYCLDGDGALIMHMGSLATTGWYAPQNFKHIVLNNLAHESVGGQPSAAAHVDFSQVVLGCGYQRAQSVDTLATLRSGLADLKSQAGPAFLEVKVNLESRADLGRPKEAPVENKRGFMEFLK